MIQSRTHLPGQRRCTSAAVWLQTCCSATAYMLQWHCICVAAPLQSWM